jgi:hypothetical protein
MSASTPAASRSPEAVLQGLSLIAAPSIFAASTFFWTSQGGRVEYGLTGGALIVVATAFWIPAFAALFGLVARAMPKTAAVGSLAATYGCIGGAAFGLDGLFAQAYGLSHDVRAGAWAAHPTVFNLTLFWPGPLFPLCLLLLGALLARTKAAPVWIAALIAASGVAFPLSRIPRLAWTAHAADGLLLIPLLFLGLRVLRGSVAVSVGRQAAGGVS